MTSRPPPEIIDSHIHLYSRSHIPSLRWASSLPSDHVLRGENSTQEYRSAISNCKDNVRGFVFIESDRLSSQAEDGWGHVLDEIQFLARMAKSEPEERRDEGFEGAGRDLVLGIVPWAPVPAGAKVMERYMSLATERCKNEEVRKKIKGVRYLVQDKPLGVMLQPAFIESLKWLGARGFSFDLGVDARNGGMWQLKEACEMLRLVFDDKRVNDKGEVRPKIVINHLCKPNLHLALDDLMTGHGEFVEWKEYIAEMASFDGTFMKLSGGFSELPSQNWEDRGWSDKVVKILTPWTDVIFDAFGPSRVMFGSDWPVCNVGGPGAELAWRFWHDIVEEILSARDLSDDEKIMVWSSTARTAYNIA
jgi:L-rhamnono-1,4-lactonase